MVAERSKGLANDLWIWGLERAKQGGKRVRW